MGWEWGRNSLPCHSLVGIPEEMLSDQGTQVYEYRHEWGESIIVFNAVGYYYAIPSYV